jgi:hypothetical protein
MWRHRLPPNESGAPLLQDDVPALVPARMLNEFAYCPRLAYLEWSQGGKRVAMIATPPI